MSYEVLVDSHRSPLALQGHLNETLGNRGVEDIHSVSFLCKGDQNKSQITYTGSARKEFPYDSFSVLCLAGPSQWSLKHDLDRQLFEQKSGEPSRVPEAFDWDVEQDGVHIMVAMAPVQLADCGALYDYKAKFWQAGTMTALKRKVRNWLSHNSDPDFCVVDIVYSCTMGQSRACAIYGTSTANRDLASRSGLSHISSNISSYFVHCGRECVV